MTPPEKVEARMGEIAVGRPPTRLVSVLGSCIGVMAFDPAAGVAGLAHVMLPAGNGTSALPAKYAETGVPALLRRLADLGASPRRLRVKIAGGARMFAHVKAGSSSDIGRRNREAVLSALAAAGLRLDAEDVGGMKGRRVSLDPATGLVEISTMGGGRLIL